MSVCFTALLIATLCTETTKLCPQDSLRSSTNKLLQLVGELMRVCKSAPFLSLATAAWKVQDLDARSPLISLSYAPALYTAIGKGVKPEASCIKFMGTNTRRFGQGGGGRKQGVCRPTKFMLLVMASPTACFPACFSTLHTFPGNHRHAMASQNHCGRAITCLTAVHINTHELHAQRSAC